MSHGFQALGCQHAGGDAQVLTGNRITGSGPQTLSLGPSIDTIIAQKTNVGGNGSCRNSEARVSKPRVVETENASPRCATAAWLSFGSA